MIEFEIQLGRMTPRGFDCVQRGGRVGGADFGQVQESAVAYLRRDGSQIGADCLRLTANEGSVVWEYP